MTYKYTSDEWSFLSNSALPLSQGDNYGVCVYGVYIYLLTYLLMLGNI